MSGCRALKKTVVGLTLGVSALALFGTTGRAERPLKVLMVGNSFSICVLNEMPAIAASCGRPLDLASLYIGGCPLSRHVANLSATNHPYDVRWNFCGRKDLAAVPFAGKLVAKTWPQGHTDQLGNLRDVLAGDRWDVVTIQQASHESWRWECFEPHADTLIAAIREEAPQAKIVIQQTWSYNKKDPRICEPKTGGPGTWKIDQDGMFACLSTNYLRLARRYGLDIIPTGCAVQRYRKAHPDLKAEDDVVGVAKTGDAIHLNARGHYLQGLVWASALLGVNALDCTYVPKEMTAADAQALRRAAAEAFDELKRLQEESGGTAAVPTKEYLDNTIRVAAVNSSELVRKAADFRCTGSHDEKVLNAAIAELTKGGGIILGDGDYFIDGFDQEGNSAVLFGYNDGVARTITVTGTTENKGYNTRHGATFHVTKAAMDAMDPGKTYRVFFGAGRKPAAPGDFFTYTHVNNVNFSKFFIFFDNASKPLIGIDGRHFGAMHLDLVGIYQKSYFNDRFMHVGAPAIPCEGTVGVWSVPSSNDEMARVGYDFVNVGGLHTGFVMEGADHVIMRVCSAARCVRGYDFRGHAKTLTLVNCCDEGNTYLPRFSGCGQVSMTDFNIERFNAKFIPKDPAGDAAEHRATEAAPGAWSGSISYTMQGDAYGLQALPAGGDNTFFAAGHGRNFEVRDLKACRRIKDGIYDLVVYGSTPAAFSAAVQARRMGKSVVIVSPETRIGGLTTGGLGQTDIGNKSAFGGIALEFYRDVAKWYADEAHWTRQKSSDYFPDGQCAGSRDGGSMWTFEPSAALQILWSWVKRDQLELRTGERLDRRAGKVKVTGEGEQRRIVSFATERGNVYRGRMFIDATYEGDLLAAAGVSYALGREDNAVYGETANGCVARDAKGAKNHNFAAPVSAYVVPGDKSSGLLPGIEPYDPTIKPGQGDRRVQAYCFRMCLTDDPENRIPFAKPASYDEREYELLFRDYEAVDAHPEIEQHGALTAKYRIPAIMSRMPNRKTDTNNRCAVSTDFIGRNWNWPEASYAERERILNAHWEYQKGLMWTLANHPRIPKEVREYFSQFGTCKDEFLDGLGEGWQRQLYVREARRMVGEYVMTEHNCRGKVAAPHPVGMGAYGMDSHNVRRIETKDGLVLNEGNIEDYLAHDGSRIQPYGIDYGALVPKRGECANLLVPVCLSASHIAFGSIRMEPVFFALGQAAATAAALAVEGGTGVQDVDYAALRRRLVTDGQVLP